MSEKRCYTHNKPNCESQYCDVETGNCIRKTKTGRPYKTKLDTKLGSSYYYDENYGLVGTMESVNPPGVDWACSAAKGLDHERHRSSAFGDGLDEGAAGSPDRPAQGSDGAALGAESLRGARLGPVLAVRGGPGRRRAGRRRKRPHGFRVPPQADGEVSDVAIAGGRGAPPECSPARSPGPRGNPPGGRRGMVGPGCGRASGDQPPGRGQAKEGKAASGPPDGAPRLLVSRLAVHARRHASWS